jgi:membrane protease YdiL (CAAX protease family)
MIGHLRVKSPWTQLGIFLGLFGAAFIIASVIMAVVVMSQGLPVTSMNKLDWSKPEVISTFNGKPLYFLGLRRVPLKQMYLLAIVGIIVAFPFVFWLGELNHQLPLPKWMGNLELDAAKQMQAFLKAENIGVVMVNVIIIALIPAICEEICFRGALQRIMIHISKNAWTGIILTSILFSALHLQFQGFLPRMFLGMLLGAIYWYSGSLWPSIVAHFITNAIQVIAVSYAPQYIDKNPSVPIFMALISGLLVFAILWMFKSFSTVTYRKVYEPDQLNSGNQFLA